MRHPFADRIDPRRDPTTRRFEQVSTGDFASRARNQLEFAAFMRLAGRAFQWFGALLPAAFRIDAKERWRAVLGAGAGILVVGLFSRWICGNVGFDPWLAAPLGASAVLLFALPASPLAQPWSVIGGNTISAFVGMACAWGIHDVAGAAAAAVAAAIALMFLLRCLHPPGGATALLAVLTHTSDARFVLLPILLNSALLVFAAALYNTLTGRRYPHVQTSSAAVTPPDGSRFTATDLDAALVHYNQVLDVSRDDLEELLHHAEAAAYRRNLGELRCGDIMSPELVTVAHDTPISVAWELMRGREIKALPVVDKSNHLRGIVTLSDFVRNMMPASPDSFSEQTSAQAFAAGDGAARMPQRVGQIMTRTVRVAGARQHVIELLPLFSRGGHHHIPIVDDNKILVGIITESDLVRALHRAVRPD